MVEPEHPGKRGAAARLASSPLAGPRLRAFAWLASPRQRTRLGLFLLVFLSYGYFVQGGGPNQNSRFDLTRAIVEQRTLRIDAYHANTIDKALFRGHYYSDKAPGLSFAAVPVYALEHAIHPSPPDGGEPDPVRMHVTTLLVVGATTAIATVVLAEWAAALGIAKAAGIVAAVGWTLGTNGFGYGTLFMAHQFVGSLLLIGAYLVFCTRARRSHNERATSLAATAGFLLGWAVISEYPAAIAATMIAGYALVSLERRDMVRFAIAAAIPGVLLLAYNAACFGSPFRLGYTALEKDTFRRTIETGFFGFGLPRADVLGEVLIGQYRGLLPLSPFLLLCLPGWASMLKRSKLRAEGALSLSICAYFLLLTASYELWHGGAAMGPRYLVPMLPFAALAVAGTLDEMSKLPSAVLRVVSLASSAALVTAGVFICTVAVTVYPEFSDLRFIVSPSGHPIDLRRPLTDFVLPLFFEGWVSQKATLGGRLGFAYASDPSRQWDAYNLGELFGLEGASSLLPLLAVWLALGLMIARALLAEQREARLRQ